MSSPGAGLPLSLRAPGPSFVDAACEAFSASGWAHTATAATGARTYSSPSGRHVAQVSPGGMGVGPSAIVWELEAEGRRIRRMFSAFAEIESTIAEFTP